MKTATHASKSMTAFAKNQINSSRGRFSWEIRSVNQRYLEINPRLPDAFRHLENEMRNQVKSMIHRGKLDVSLSFENPNANLGMELNQPAFEALQEAISQIQQNLPEATQVNPLEVLQWPGILQHEQSADQQKEIDQAVLDGLQQSLVLLDEHRLREGQALAQLIIERVFTIRQYLDDLEPLLPEILNRHVEKLKQRILNLSEQLDEQRLHQEVAILAQKMDVAEEIDRIRTHLVEVEHNLASNMLGKPVGRRLDFLMQELNREANTLGSKSIHVITTQVAVELKVLIEQMREQIQNIE